MPLEHQQSGSRPFWTGRHARPIQRRNFLIQHLLRTGWTICRELWVKRLVILISRALHGRRHDPLHGSRRRDETLWRGRRRGS